MNCQSEMSKRASKRVNFSPDVNEKPTMLLKQGGGSRVSRQRKRVAVIWSFRLLRSSSFSPVRFLRRLGDRVVRALRFMSMRRRSSRRVSSSSLTRSRSLVDPIDSHRAEAVEDCIEFLNSSACFQRSNSISGSSCSSNLGLSWNR